jgi:phage baseplate assembly protein W
MPALTDSGIQYPFAFAPAGSVATSDDLPRIRQSIRQILGTRPGERAMRPDFGCGLHALLFEHNTAVFQALARRRILDALRRWEPRISVTGIDFAHPDTHAVEITISYRVGALTDSLTHQLDRG